VSPRIAGVGRSELERSRTGWVWRPGAKPTTLFT